MNSKTIALIGSFRQHYASILEALNIFKSKGHTVTTPIGTMIIEEGVQFVRFESDLKSMDDCGIQSIALHRILRADLVYVIAPGGYIGRTTCYEIGRIIQAKQPIYFSEKVNDLPLRIPDERVYLPEDFSCIVGQPGWKPSPIFSEISHPNDELENDLINGIYREH